MATKQQNSARWDLGRFVKTLSYFGAIPWFSDRAWFQQWFGNRPHPTVDSATLNRTTLAYRASASPEPNRESLLPMQNMPTQKTIFDFRQASSDIAAIWGALDDVVMGGVSQSGIQINTEGAAFAGTVSIANSGGFASVRTRNFEPPIDLSAFTGIALRVKGDGKRYKYMLRTETRWDGIAHCYSFDTEPDTWITIQIPFTAFVPVFRAKTVADAPLDPSHIYAMQLMLSKFEYDGALNPRFEPGWFQLQIESIQAYSG